MDGIGLADNTSIMSVRINKTEQNRTEQKKPRNGWKMLEMTANGLKYPEKLKIARNGLKWLELTERFRRLLKGLEMAKNY